MRKLLGLFLMLVIVFSSCEGRKTTHHALSESIEAFKEKVSLEVDVFEPETYVEHQVDTLMSNGYRVKIKTYSDMDSSVLYTKIKDTINYQTHYRNYKFSILVEKEGKQVFNKQFNKGLVNEILSYNANSTNGSALYNFDKLAVLKSIEVTDNTALTNVVSIDILYAIPESNRYAIHRLYIDENGKFNVKKVEVN